MDVTFVLTHDCNLGCGYCYAGRKFKASMPRDVARAGLDLAFAGEPDRVELCYFGGEPTLEFELLFEIARDAKERARERGIRLRQSVTTNGTLLTKKSVRALAELGVYVALSIDGTRAAHEANRPTMGGGSSYDDVSRGLDLLIAERAAFETISVVTPASAKHLGASVAELFDRGVPRLSLNPCYEAVWSDDDLATWGAGLEDAARTMAGWFLAGRTVSVNVFDNKILARAKGGLERRDKCPIGDGSVAIAPSGNLYPCERLVAEDESKQHVIGHVLDGVDRARLAGVHAPSADGHATNEECGSCAERARCSAYCACANMAETGETSVAGGVQCWHEQTVARIADALLLAMLAKPTEAFLGWYFPHGVPDTLAPVAAALPSVGRARRLAIVRS